MKAKTIAFIHFIACGTKILDEIFAYKLPLT